MTDLNTTLQKHQQLLGPNYQNLGKWVGKGVFKKKMLASYHRDKGWDVVQLNLAQFCLRKIFGFYHSTHLDTIARGWNRSIKQHTLGTNPEEVTLQAFDQKIHSLWQKTHRRPFPETVFFDKKKHSIVVKNAETKSLFNHMLNQAKVLEEICLTDNLEEIEKETHKFLQDLPEFLTFTISNAEQSALYLNRYDALMKSYLAKVKNNEVDKSTLPYVAYSILQRVLSR